MSISSEMQFTLSNLFIFIILEFKNQGYSHGYLFDMIRLFAGSSYCFASLPKWATVDPYSLNGSAPHTVANILDGKTVTYKKTIPIVDPLNG